jgi:hypothetical protein
MQREKDESKLSLSRPNPFSNDLVQLLLLLLLLLLLSFSRFGTLLTNVLTMLSVIGKPLSAASASEHAVLVQAIVANWT